MRARSLQAPSTTPPSARPLRVRALSLCSVLALGVIVSGGEARAQADAHLFRPALFNGSLMAVDRVVDTAPWEPSMSFLANFARRPLRLELSQGQQDMLDWALAFHVQGQLSLLRGVELAFDAPFARHGFADAGRTLVEGASASNVEAPETSPLDMRVGLRVNLLRRPLGGLALALEGRLPFGNEEVFAGSGAFAVEPKILATAHLGPLTLAGNVGFRLGERQVLVERPSGASQRVLAGSGRELTFAASLAVSVVSWLEVGVETYGLVGVGLGEETFVDRQVLPAGDPGCPAGSVGPCEVVETRKGSVPGGLALETILAARVDFGHGVAGRVGGGLALSGDRQRASFRLLAGVLWRFGADRSGDRDQDGIIDSLDHCPAQAEDIDGVDDADGCPDVDLDGDGVADHLDRCPRQAEDLDGFQDGDGCPDPDNDKDGIPDAEDRCPLEAEDKDGVNDGDGCPDLDDDGDGIPDKADKCPLEAETRNGYRDQDGCPDTDPAKVLRF